MRNKKDLSFFAPLAVFLLSFFFLMRMDRFLCLFQHHESKAELITEPGTFNNLLFRELISINALQFASGLRVT